ncbi:hypothetical protein M3Y99_00272300 [Aphelenchoides fujianensis]|nr:hypothetical protein M3Y99_00272300 [Aphelenchoides fujianensis]
MFDSSIDLLLPHISLWLSLIFMFAARGAPQDVFRMGVDFEGIRFEKLVFFDNTTLLEDVTFVDRMVAEAKRREPGGKEELVVELLLIGDYSMFEKFREFYPHSDETANIALRDYLTAVFQQASDTETSEVILPLKMKSMYDRFLFFNQTRLALRLVDVMPIIREEDCPILNHPTAQFNETFDVEEAFTSLNETGELTSEDGGIGAFDALKAIHSWLEEKMPLLPPHDHSVVITRQT